MYNVPVTCSHRVLDHVMQKNHNETGPLPLHFYFLNMLMQLDLFHSILKKKTQMALHELFKYDRYCTHP